MSGGGGGGGGGEGVKCKGGGKRGHNIVDTNVSPFARARNICRRHKICVRDTKMFLISFRNILCPQQMFPGLRSIETIMSNNVSGERGGGGSGGMLPWENLGFSYSHISEGGFKINKQCVKAQRFYNLKQQLSANNNGANVPGSTRDY